MSLYGGIELPGHPCPENVRRLDLLPIPQIRRMMRMGVGIDKEWLWELGSKLESRKVELRKEISSYVPPDKLEEFVSSSSGEGEGGMGLELNVESAEQVATLLFKLLGVGSGRQLKRTKSGKRVSTGKKQLETLKREHAIVPLILEYREASKLKNTYTDRLPEIARLHPRGEECLICGRPHREDHWRVHTEILTTRTDTGRLASKSPNLQNIPVRTVLGREVRKAFVPQPGWKLVAADYSQFELRLLAHLSRDANMLRIFREGGDIHLATAMRAFGIDDPKKVDKILHRAPCKNVNFGIAYGLTYLGLYDLMALTHATAGVPVPDWLDEAWCMEFILKWFELYPQCVEYFELQHYRAKRYEIVWTMCGRVRPVPEVRSVHKRIREAGLRQAGNMPIQGSQADIFKVGMARVERRLVEWRAAGVGVEALLPIHDELLVEVEEGWEDEVKTLLEWEMGRAMHDGQTGELRCRVPILTEGKVMEEDRWTKE